MTSTTPNPLLSDSQLPFGLPDYPNIVPEHYSEAFEAGIDAQREEIAAIVDNEDAPTFENTLEALERSGQLLRRAALAYFTVAPSHATPEIDTLRGPLSESLEKQEDYIYLNRALFERVQAVAADGLNPEQTRLRDEYLRGFQHRGIDLSDEAQAEVRELNAEIAKLLSEFSTLVQQEGNDGAVLFDSAEELDGLDEEQIAAPAQAADDAGHSGKYLLTIILPSNQPAVASLRNRESRRRVYLASVNRGLGERGSEGSQSQQDTTAIAARIAALRARKAQLFGKSNYAEYAVENQTAPSYSAVRAMMERLAPPAVANARAEQEALAQTLGHDVEPWDWAFASGAVETERFELDAAALRPWFELERVLNDGVFYAANQLFGLQFEEIEQPSYHPEVRTWLVRDADGEEVGLFLGDFFTRDTKNGGAWMNPIVEQSRLLGNKPVVVNNSNFTKPAEGKPAFLSLDEVRTLFHEFGHALHGLLSNVEYPSLSGTSVPRDFVEYPSQVNEMWILHPEILANYAKHYETGEPLPDGVVDKLKASAVWGEGFATTEYLGAALLDLAWHEITETEPIEDPLAFEQRALADAGVELDAVPPRYRTGYFKHIFAGGYAAGYYSYIWSEVLDADTVTWFEENGGLTRKNGDRFRSELLSRGNSRDPLESFRVLRGRDAELAPLLKRRGLDQTEETASTA